MQEGAQFYINIARFHPLIVHLPIGILFFALLMALLRRWRKRADLDFPIRLALLFGAVSSVFAAITGWFLSDEGGYDPDALFWHKWIGISLAVGASLSYVLHVSRSEKLQRVYFPVLIVTSVLLIVTGHLGGNMTHGEDYLFSKPAEELTIAGDIEQVHVYKELIAPILDNKCNSCHNESKAKGELIMTTQAGLFAGGKSGQIFDFEETSNSEMLKRIHLPNAEKKHMPPKGKVQLDENEIELISWWIANQACVDCLVADTKERAGVESALAEIVNKGPVFDVEPLSAREFEELQEANIPVSKVAEEHPMIIVNLAHRKDLEKATFKKLRAIAGNVLELNLAGSNMTDELARNLPSFTNLRKLQLQNTEITKEAIGQLTELENLVSLNVYQTNISDEAISDLLKLTNLKQLYLWKTKVTETAVEELKSSRPELAIQYEISEDIFGENRLGSPIIAVENPIFKGSTEVTLSSYLSGVDIYYTLDGSDPDTLSIQYTSPFSINQSTLVKAVNFKKGWIMSEPTEMKLLEIKTIPTKVSLATPPKEKYKANGANSLVDGKKGSQRFTDGLWVGYEAEDMVATLELSGDESIEEVTVSALSEQGSWIFYPKGIEVLASSDGENYRRVGQLSIPLEEPPVLVSGMKYFKVPAEIGRSKYARVVVKSNLKNPAWHPSPGGKSWIFIDEILLN